MERLAKQPGEDGAAAKLPETSWEASFDPAQPLPQFSFAGTTTYLKVDLEKEIQDLGRWTSTDPRALKALRRGIVIHHAGMNKAYRSLVERFGSSLFYFLGLITFAVYFDKDICV
jgi:ATP-dependent RNA helicase DDX60